MHETEIFLDRALLSFGISGLTSQIMTSNPSRPQGCYGAYGSVVHVFFVVLPSISYRVVRQFNLVPSSVLVLLRSTPI
jgi:hypothetical protein